MSAGQNIMNRRGLLAFPSMTFLLGYSRSYGQTRVPGTAVCAPAPLNLEEANDRLLAVIKMLTRANPNFIKEFLAQEAKDGASTTPDRMLNYRTAHLKSLVEILVNQPKSSSVKGK